MRLQPIGMLAALLALAACQNKPAITLPVDPIAKAATCYAARITEFSSKKGILTAEQTDQVTQFVYLGAINDGIAEPTKLPQVMSKAEALRPGIEKAGNAADYRVPCAKAFPATVEGSFKQLPPDDRATRMMCLTLSTAALQVYRQNNVVPSPDLIKMNTQVDDSLTKEIEAEGNINPAELAGFAMRNMAKAVELGPTGDVLKACIGRYAKG